MSDTDLAADDSSRQRLNADLREPVAACPIVGIGASAGGLEALMLFLKALPADTGMGFVIVLHLTPGRPSTLAEILARATQMPVCEVSDEAEVQPDHVYVIPPGRGMTAMKESEKRFRVMANAMPQLAWIPRADGHIFWYNQRWHEYTGTTPEEMEGWAWQSVHDPETLPEVLEIWKASISSGKLFEMTFPLRGADGQFRQFLTRVIPLTGESGTILHWFGTNTDVSKILETEEELRRAHLKLQNVLGSITDGLAIMDKEWRFTYFSEQGARMLGVRAEDMVGGLLLEIFPEVVESKFFGAFQRAIETRLPVHFDDYYPAPISRWLECHCYPSDDGLSVYFNDVTERHSQEQAMRNLVEDLAQAARSKDEFLAMLAHELRNPLAPLQNAAEILNANATTAAARSEAQRVIGRQIENMKRMIDDLLDVSRITQGKIVLHQNPLELQAILTAAAQIAQQTCEHHGQVFTISLPHEAIYINGDPTRLDQVFGNLLGNACKYSGSGCHIHLSAEILTADEVTVRIADDGIGIDPELLPTIFELFVQSSRTLDRSHGGLGIGLTIVHRLVTLHGGTVEVRSAGLGHGCEFTVRLPVIRPPALSLPAARVPASMASRRMLIVDDNHDAAESMAMLQTLYGHETRTAHSGPEALEIVADFLPQVVLLDIGLPEMDGYEIAQRIRALPALANVFLVALSGYSTEDDRRRSKAAGFDEHLAKPADLKLLNEWLRTRL